MSIETISRRQFFTASIGLSLAAGTATLSSRVLGANERFVVAVMGVRGRGRLLAKELAKRPFN